MNNVLIAYECTHYLKRKNGACAIKLDMAKVYNRVEWAYLEGMMLWLSFCESFVMLIMRCVTSVSFSIRINGVLSKTFRPTRGTSKATEFHLTYFYYVHRVSQHFLSRLVQCISLGVLEWVCTPP